MDFYIMIVAIGCSLAGFIYGYHRGSRDAIKAFEEALVKKIQEQIDRESENGA